MKRIPAVAAAVVFAACLCAAGRAEALESTPYGLRAQRRAAMYPWHGQHYHTSWGAPVALVVPPTAGMRTEYRWGVGGYGVYPIDHQFGRPYPGGGMYGNGGFYPTPRWPSSTFQFGVYPVRAPWH